METYDSKPIREFLNIFNILMYLNDLFVIYIKQLYKMFLSFNEGYIYENLFNEGKHE